MAHRRLINRDYKKPGFYFVTINTSSRIEYFSEIKNGSLYLSGIGEIANYCWTQIPNHFENARIHEFIIMPDHIHGIIELIPDSSPVTCSPVACNGATCNRAANLHKSESIATFQTGSPEWYSSISPKSGSLSTIIRSYKSAVTRIANLSFKEIHFGWQASFYDRIIRNKEEFNRIKWYINRNPLNWKEE